MELWITGAVLWIASMVVILRITHIIDVVNRRDDDERMMMGKHRGRFKWKKYSRYKGALRQYWEDHKRMVDRHRERE